MQSAPFARGHSAQAAGSPATAVASQSLETEAGEPQLVSQNVDRSPQLGSTPGFVGPPGVMSPPDEAGGAVQVPRWTLTFWSAQTTLVPPTQARSPHASVRRSPENSTSHVHSVWEEPHAASATSPATTPSKRARCPSRTLRT